MHVVLDCHSVLRERHSGFFTYGAGLLRGFAELEDAPQFTLLTGAHPSPAWTALTDGKPYRTAAIRGKMRHWQNWWTWTGFPALQRWTDDFDVYHSVHHLMPPCKGRPRVLTVHDLRRHRLPDFYPNSKTNRFDAAVRQADHLIAISQATKNDLLEFFDLDEKKISVVYHGGAVNYGAPAAPNETALPTGLTPGEYFVVFSSYDRRKNLPNILRAFELATKELPDEFRLGIVGVDEKKAAELLAPLTPTVRERIVCTGRLDDCTTILRKAAALVFATLYEGFGLPPLEAMQAGTAVITSNCSSMPEVVGEAGLLVPPHEPQAIAAAMVTLGTDQTQRHELATAGRERAKLFSWRRAAEETLAVYQNV